MLMSGPSAIGSIGPPRFGALASITMPMTDIFKTVRDDRGVSLISYALMVSLIGIVSFAAASAVGSQVSDNFGQVTGAFGGDTIEPTTTTTAPLSPKEKWDKAQADWKAAIDGANANYAADLAAANATLAQAKAANNSLPAAQKKAANQQATATFNATKATAKAEQTASTQAANAAKSAAKAEYLATK